jgi:hypothetical protein
MVMRRGGIMSIQEIPLLRKRIKEVLDENVKFKAENLTLYKRIKELEEELRGYRAIEKDNRDHCRNPLSVEESAE